MRLEDEIKQKSFRSGYHKVAVNLIYTYNWYMNYQQQLLKPFDITPQQFNILRILRGQYPAPATIKLIKERMLDKMSDASRIVEKLRLKGLIKRDQCDMDRRRVDIVITQKGLDILAKTDKQDEIIDRLLSGLDETEINALNDYLDKLREGRL